MVSVYAHIHDATMKKEVAAFHREVLNFAGQVVQVNDIETGDVELQAKTDTNLVATASQLDLFAELELLDIKINSTLEQLMTDTPAGIIETAIQSLKQAQETGSVKNPGGFLYKAITDCWQPNEEAGQRDQDLAEFNEWWKWAYGKGLAIASQQTDQGIMVLTKDEQWIDLQNAIDYFKQLTKQRFSFLKAL